MKKIFLFLTLFLSLGALKAQERAVYTHYHLNPILVFPSYAGFHDNHEIILNIRNQFTGFAGAPKTYGISYNGALSNKFGIGVGLLTDKVDEYSRLRALINYAYRYQVGTIKMAAGFSMEFERYRIDESLLSDELYEPDDQVVSNYIDGEKIFDATLSFNAVFNKNTFAGIAFPNLVLAKIGSVDSGEPQGALFKYFIGYVGHHIEVESKNYYIEPSVIFKKIKNVPFLFDMNVKAGFLEEKLIAGLSYRVGVGGGAALLLGTKFSKVSAYYSFDYSFQKFQRYNNGSHELTIKFELPGKKDEIMTRL